MRFRFAELESLRLLCRQIQQDQTVSLQYFKYGVGFRHVPSREGISVSSSATCVLSLIAAGSWTQSRADTKALLKDLIARDTSAGLPKNNPFTTAWILEAVTMLENYSDPLDDSDRGRLVEKENILHQALKRGKGGISIASYPASPYLTQLVVRVLRLRQNFPLQLGEEVKKRAWSDLARQLALVQANSKTQDPFAVAYLLMLVTAVTPSSNLNPEETSLQRAALKAVFDSQLKDGSWPLSRPLFHYPGFGNAYCYEYEMLTQLLNEGELRDLLLPYVPKLGIAAEAIQRNVYRAKGGVPAWTSGHHPNQAEPESWATASVYHFVHEFDRLLAEAVRRELFRYLETPFPRVVAPSKDIKEENFAPEFLDSTIEFDGRMSLRKFLWERLVAPLAREASEIASGRTFRKGTPRSAIFFGPPGTSKTELTANIADFLGWPLLAIDPSLLLRKGMEGIQAEANAIFRMLEQTERVVVLFDEFDEFVRERGSSEVEPFSRLLTTAMLPKLANIHKRAMLVFIIATNNIQEFDLAIRRQGRFDHVVQIMPPTYEAKIGKVNWGPMKVDLGQKLQDIGLEVTSEIREQIGDLTYGECEALATDLAEVTTAQTARSKIARFWNNCTLQSPVSKEDGETWAERCRAEAKLTH